MAERFMRVDLNEEARDFKPIAIEPGVPLLDRAGSNAKILYRWLGDLVAEPEWEGESANFYVRDEEGGRLEEIQVMPATTADLKGILQPDVEKIRQRIESAKPETSTERAIKSILRRTFTGLIDDPHRSDHDSFFFKYQNVNGTWRLVWAWGYQRLDLEPAPAVVCSSPVCSLLFVRRPGQSSKCPACEATLSGRKMTKKERQRRKRMIYGGLFLLAALLLLLLLWPASLVATPDDYAGPVGSRINFKVKKASLLWSRDVTDETVGYALNPAVARFDRLKNSALLVNPGSTTVLFRYGDMHAEATLIARVPTPPQKLRIEPDVINLAVGTTARPVVYGVYADGSEVDLTEVVEWPALYKDFVYCNTGFLEGIAPGEELVAVKYIAQPGDPELRAEARVIVSDTKLTSLTTSIDPATVGVDRTSALKIDAIGEDGNTYSVLESSKLDTTCSPDYLAAVEGSLIRGKNQGQGRFVAGFEELTAETPLVVGEVPVLDPPVVSPDPIEMVVGEIIDMTVLSDIRSPIHLSADDPEIIGVTAENRLVGRGVGTTTVRVRQGSEMWEVKATVSKAQFESLSIDPLRVVVPVDHTVKVRVLAQVIVKDVPTAEDTTDEATDEAATDDDAAADETTTDDAATEDTTATADDTDTASADDTTATEEETPADDAAAADETTTEEEEPTVEEPQIEVPQGPTMRSIEVDPELLTCTSRPNSKYATFNQRTMSLRGYNPTDRPERLSFRLGELTASAPVEVVIAPLRLILEPEGQLELPLGQMRSLDAWAMYSGGFRARVAPERVTWHSELREGGQAGVELDKHRICAMAEGGGPLAVWGNYHTATSNEVEVTAVAPENLSLRIEADRNVLVVGETGKVRLIGTGPSGDVELVPSLATLTSSNPGVLAIDEKTGEFRAAGPGGSAIRGTHVGAPDAEAMYTMNVFAKDNVSIEFEPKSLTVAVDQQADLQLYLVASEAGAEVTRVPIAGPGVGISLDKPDTVKYSRSIITGVRPSGGPFQARASFAPSESTTQATIDVIAPTPPVAIRIVPGETTIAPGASLMLRVEQTTDETADVWTEVCPAAVTWMVDSDLIATPGTMNMPTMVTAGAEPGGPYEVTAVLDDLEAVARITVADGALDPADPTVGIVVDRTPDTIFVPVGQSQRLILMLDKDGTSEAAPSVVWPANFENEHIKWNAPEITALRAGYRQLMRAKIDGRNVLFTVVTYDPEEYRPIGEDIPTGVYIWSKDGEQSLTCPAGAMLDDFDFTVTIELENGDMKDLTNKAQLQFSTPNASGANGIIQALQAGTVNVTAMYGGVKSAEPLTLNITPNVDIDRLTVNAKGMVPDSSKVVLMPGENFGLEVRGYKGETSVGILNNVPGVSWSGSNPSIAAVSGPSIAGIALGEASVSSQLAGITGTSPVEVVADIADPLQVKPKILKIAVGQGIRLGSDVIVERGPVDVSQLVTAEPVMPGMVTFNPMTRTLVGQRTGKTQIVYLLGPKRVKQTVEITPGVSLAGGTIIVEPGNVTLAKGQSIIPQVYVQLPNGQRIDQTETAVFSSSAQNVAPAVGKRICAMGPGTAQISVSVVGADSTGSMTVNVQDVPITSLSVEPPALSMIVGESVAPRVIGHAATGSYELFPQRDLLLTTASPNLQIEGRTNVRASAQGQGSVNVSWKQQLTQQVPVTVAGNQLSGLYLEPGNVSIGPGQVVPYQVYAYRGGRQVMLGQQDGVTLSVSNPAVAQVVNGTMVRAIAPGETQIVAQVGGQTAQAHMRVGMESMVSVVPGGGVIATDDYYVDGGVVVRDGVVTGDILHDRIIGGDGVIVYDDDDILVGGGGYVDNNIYAVPATELRFDPSLMPLDVNSPPTAFRVIEFPSNRDVTSEVTLSDPVRVAQRQGNVIVPQAPGEEVVTAQLGGLTASMIVSVGQANAVLGQLQVSPSPLTVFLSQPAMFERVDIVPGNGQLPYPAADYTVSAAPGQPVSIGPDGKTITANGTGMAQVTVTATTPAGGQVSTVALVQVASADPITVVPSVMSIGIGQATPPLTVMARDSAGMEYPVAATVEALNANILDVDPSMPGQFIGKSMGMTQVRATYQGQEAYAEVSVTGERFVQVDPVAEQLGGNQFSVNVGIQAAQTEGPLEYRVYQAGGQPMEVWTPAVQDPATGQLKVNLRSPVIPMGTSDQIYQLTLEARNSNDGSVQQFPLTFQLGIVVKRTNQ